MSENISEINKKNHNNLNVEKVKNYIYLKNNHHDISNISLKDAQCKGGSCFVALMPARVYLPVLNLVLWAT